MKTLKKLSDAALCDELDSLAQVERVGLAKFLVYLTEFSGRNLFTLFGYTSLAEYLNRRLGYSEASSQKRSEACGRFMHLPRVLQYLKDGGVYLSKLKAGSSSLH